MVGEALLVIVTAAVRLPATDGVKETRTEHDWLGCKTVGARQVSPERAKSPAFGPVMATVFRLSA